MNPYRGLEDYRFWRRSVSNVETHLFNPVINPVFRIARDARVATAGSCFAQHIARTLRDLDFNYFVTEAGEDLDAATRDRRNYGVFSARFGNIYTTAQLRQLVEEAFGERVPAVTAMRRGDGRWVDPYRPQIDPDGYADEAAVTADRAVLLAAVRRMVLEADVFVFTLGLTEAWRSRRDGSVFPIAPGVAAGAFDPAEHEFVNFDVDAVVADLRAALDAMRAHNPGLRVLLTVSPVPLVATYEDRSVLVSTTYSKAVLRVAAETMVRGQDWIQYFPSYEIITGSFSGGLYYEADYREVNRLGVAHAMRCFVDSLVEGGRPPASGAYVAEAPPKVGGVICDEEMLDAVRG